MTGSFWKELSNPAPFLNSWEEQDGREGISLEETSVEDSGYPLRALCRRQDKVSSPLGYELSSRSLNILWCSNHFQYTPDPPVGDHVVRLMVVHSCSRLVLPMELCFGHHCCIYYYGIYADSPLLSEGLLLILGYSPVDCVCHQHHHKHSCRTLYIVLRQGMGLYQDNNIIL